MALVVAVFLIGYKYPFLKIFGSIIDSNHTEGTFLFTIRWKGVARKLKYRIKVKKFLRRVYV